MSMEYLQKEFRKGVYNGHGVFTKGDGFTKGMKGFQKKQIYTVNGIYKRNEEIYKRTGFKKEIREFTK